MNKLLIAVALASLTGCAARSWTRPDTTQTQVAQDKYNCLGQASAIFPAAIVSRPSNPPPEGQMVAGRYVAPSITQYLAAAMPTSYDANASNRDNAFSECMRSLGYEYKRSTTSRN